MVDRQKQTIEKSMKKCYLHETKNAMHVAIEIEVRAEKKKNILTALEINHTFYLLWCRGIPFLAS